MLMGSVRIAVQNIIDLMDDLDLSSHNYIKSHFGPYLGFCWTNCCQIITKGSLDRGLSVNKKHLERFERKTYANTLRWPPLYKKTSLAITFKVRHLG